MQTTSENKNPIIHFKSILMILVAFKVVTIGGFMLYFLELRNPKATPPQACLNNQCISLEIADTPEKRALGLMGRKELGEHQAMLLDFDKEGLYKVWMKATFIPLDILWLDRENKVIDIQAGTPCLEEECPSYSPNSPALYILQLNQGKAKAMGIEVGNTLEIKK